MRKTLYYYVMRDFHHETIIPPLYFASFTSLIFAAIKGASTDTFVEQISTDRQPSVRDDISEDNRGPVSGCICEVTSPPSLTPSVQTTCRVTQDKSKQNLSAAIVFHFPDLHWEGYNYPQYRQAIFLRLILFQSAKPLYCQSHLKKTHILPKMETYLHN